MQRLIHNIYNSLQPPFTPIPIIPGPKCTVRLPKTFNFQRVRVRSCRAYPRLLCEQSQVAGKWAKV